MQIRYLAILDLNGAAVTEHIPNHAQPKASSSSAVVAALNDEKQPNHKAPLTKELLQRARESTPTGLLSFKNRNQQQEYYLSFNKQRAYVIVIDTPLERLSLGQARAIFHAMEKTPTTAGLAAIAKNPPREAIVGISADIETIKEVMLENIEKALERGERIELLVDKADSIGKHAVKFNNATKSIANDQCCTVCCCDICCCDFSSCLSWFKRNCCCCGPCTCNDKAPKKNGYGSLEDVNIARPAPSKQTMG